MEAQRRDLLRTAAREFATCGVRELALAYKPVLDEFCAVSEQFRLAQPRYNELFERLVDVLCEEYGVKRDIVYVRLGNYGTNVWGNLYWRFLHLTSILLEHAMHANRINDPLDFPLLVYNVDCVLPCANCALHYRQIKESVGVKSALKEMSFGMLVSGLQTFHNIVTRNVDRTPEYANAPDRPTFTMIDFARAYRCLERVPNGLLKSNVYVRPRVDWQPDTHRMLTIFYALATKRTYSPCSDLLKLRLYGNGEIAATVPSVDGLPIGESSERILAEIDRAILMRVDEQAANGNAEIYNRTIVEFYHAYPDYVRALLELPSFEKSVDDETRSRIKERIEKLLERVNGSGGDRDASVDRDASLGRDA